MKKDDVLGGRYKLHKHLGSGGMAVVWQAEDLLDERLVAVKCLRTKSDLLDSLDEDEAHDELRRMRGRFRREGALLGRLRNSSIPELYDQGLHGSEPFS
jgi:eukaryotic-like serine/threonine-protein kinase